jgi:hypothetical protein
MKRLALFLVLFLLCGYATAVTTSQLQTQINQLTTRVTATETSIKALQSAQATTTASIEEVKKLIVTMQADVAAMKVEIEQLKAKLPAPTPEPTPDPVPPPPTAATCPEGSIPLEGGTFSQLKVLNTASATYCVKGPMTFDRTAFSVQANNVTVICPDKQTVTYGAKTPYTDVLDATGNNRAYGVLGVACYQTNFGSSVNACGGTFENFTLNNCKLVQAGGGPFSDAIRVGQGGGNTVTLINNTIEVNGNSARIFSSTYAGGHKGSGNTFISKVTKIQSRHQMDGVMIKIGEGGGKAPSEFHDNVFSGGIQGGLLDSNPLSKHYRNKMSINSFFTNGFCLYAWGSGQSFYENVCDTTQGTDAGRGIQITSANVSVYDNEVIVRELPRNAEYNGCVAGGAYAVQLEASSSGAKVYRNKLTAKAGSCDATAVRASGGNSTSPNIIENNVVRVLKDSITAPGRAWGFTFRGCANCIFQNHFDFIADSYCYYDVTQGPDPATNVKLSSNTCTKGPNAPTTFATWFMDNYGNTSTITGTSLLFNGMSGLEAKSWAVGQPVSLMHKRFDIYLNNMRHLYNDAARALVVDDWTPGQ